MTTPVDRFGCLVTAALLALGLTVSPAAAQDPQAFQYKNITTDATTTLKTTPGVLHAITINSPTATTTITVFDNTTNSGTKVGTITVPSSPMPVTLVYDISFWVGLTIVTGTATSDITVAFR